MSSLSVKCGGGGWTLVMKLNRDKVNSEAHHAEQYTSFLFSPGSIRLLTRQVLMSVREYIDLS